MSFKKTKLSFLCQLLIISIMIILGYSSGYTYCTYTSGGSYCSSGCCYNYSSTYRTCQSYYSSCSSTSNYNDVYDTAATISVGVIIAISVGSFLCFVLTIVGIVCAIRAYNRNRQQSNQMMANIQTTNADLNYGAGMQTVPQYPPQFGNPPQYGNTYNPNMGMGMGLQQPYHQPYGPNVPYQNF